MTGAEDASPEFDVVVMGGGPAGSVLASSLGRGGRRVLVVEHDIHPREHVGESLTPSVNQVLADIGALDRIDAAGFVRKQGACWTAPNAPVGKFVSIRLDEFPVKGAPLPYAFNVERDLFDALLLRHAAEQGAIVLQGVRAEQVLFEDGRAVGVRVKVLDGWERDIRAKVVVDATGRTCLLARQLGLKRKDRAFEQVSIYSWFRGVEPLPGQAPGMIALHFLGLERAWVWQIPLQNGVTSVGVVTDRADFAAGRSQHEAFFRETVERNATLSHVMRGAERLQDLRVEGDYSYEVEQLTGPGWVLVGDALRFVDPIFSSGVDVACYSGLHAAEAVEEALRTGDEPAAFDRYVATVSRGVEVWYELIALFYKLQNLFTYFALRPRYREDVVRILQGNLYQPESQARARSMIATMQGAYDRIMARPDHLLRPGAMGEVTPAGGTGRSRRSS